MATIINLFNNDAKRITLSAYHGAVKSLATAALEMKVIGAADYTRLVEVADGQLGVLARKSATSAAKRAEKRAAAGDTPLPESYREILETLTGIVPIGLGNAQTVSELNAMHGVNLSALNTANAVKRGGAQYGILKAKRGDGKSVYYRDANVDTNAE